MRVFLYVLYTNELLSLKFSSTKYQEMCIYMYSINLSDLLLCIHCTNRNNVLFQSNSTEVAVTSRQWCSLEHR